MKRTAQAIANEIRMARSQFSGIYVIVEGSTDVKVYGGFAMQESVRFIDAREKHVVVDAIRLLNAEQQAGVLAIADADFNRIPPHQLPQEPNLLHCDLHDLEAMLFASPALEKVVRELGSTEKIRVLEEKGTPLRTLLFDAGRVIGALRFFSFTAGLDLCFDETKYSKLIADNTAVADPVRIVRAIKNHSQSHHLSDDYLLRGLDDVLDQNLGHDELVCGHDLAAILAIWLRRLIGSCGSTGVTGETVEALLRIGYERSFFESTQIYQAMRAWEAEWSRTRLFSF